MGFPISIRLLIVGLMTLVACSPQAEKKVVKPLTMEQVVQKTWQQSIKQTNMSAFQYERKEQLPNGFLEGKIDYANDTHYYYRKVISDYIREEYQLPKKQYSKVVYEGEQGKWRVAPFVDSFQKKDMKSVTTSGKMDELLPKYHIEAFKQSTPLVKMTEQPTTYQLQLTITDQAKIESLMQDYVALQSEISASAKLVFSNYHTIMTIDKKDFKIKSVMNKVSLKRELVNLDTGKRRFKDFDMSTTIEYPNTNPITVPQKVINDVGHDPF